ncbi:energy transducer TonB [Mucilaginibacter psychrotolerans]|uniref:TonB family protein n=1 Tax=Mucilaginibacter psychrotolerans TaxID=1524096 RepID=A0A4Y8SLK7_9SPHI|nr:energy transducer TonB [Mucilaginibacter psychrotolerans]TFF39581.1 TonB family protein [Mucilaginibacter psychrotolerans]
MIKTLPILLFSCLLSLAAIAQKSKKDAVRHDSTAYYMRNQYDMALNQATAEFLRLIIKVDSGMYEIQDYYPDGTLRLLAKSYSGERNFEPGANGVYTEYYKSGRKKLVKQYIKGKQVGNDSAYYANGKLYRVISYDSGEAFLKTCLDSTGKLLADNGNGSWVNMNPFDDLETFTGAVVNGKEDGIWIQRFAGDTATYKIQNKNGMRLPNEQLHVRQIFQAVEQQPSFGGGDSAFGQFLSYTLRYPDYAREHKITGRVILTFVVEANGHLTDIKVLRSPDESLSKEALRVMKLSPAWRPGIQNGRPVRVQFSVPIAFALSND